MSHWFDAIRVRIFVSKLKAYADPRGSNSVCLGSTPGGDISGSGFCLVNCSTGCDEAFVNEVSGCGK